jgi:hypothetical protein
MPSDAVSYLESRLPDEVYHYLSNGLINARVLQWRTTCHVFDQPPMDGGESPEYRALVSSKLTPLRTTTISLLSSSLHNWYRHKNLELRCWFLDAGAAQEIRVVGTQESLTVVDSWNVKEAGFKEAVSKHKVRHSMFDYWTILISARTAVSWVRLSYHYKTPASCPRPSLRRTRQVHCRQ